MVSTNELASEIASNVRAELVRLGRVEEAGVRLRDGNRAGVGDVIMARENDYSTSDHEAEPVINRSVYVVDRNAVPMAAWSAACSAAGGPDELTTCQRTTCEQTSSWPMRHCPCRPGRHRQGGRRDRRREHDS